MVDTSQYMRAKPFKAFLADIKTQGVNLVSADEQGIPYAILPARNNARWWLVPIKNSKEAVNGLDMFQPVTGEAKCMKFVVQGLTRLGLSRIWSKTILYFSGLPDIIRYFSVPVESCAYFTGTDSPHRKTAIQFMAKGGETLGYAKISAVSAIVPFMQNEAKVLELVNSLEMQTIYMPQLIFSGDANGAHILVTDGLRGKGFTSPTKLGTSHWAFLNEMVEKTSHHEAPPLCVALRAQYAQSHMVMSTEWRGRIEAALTHLEARPELPTCLAHGDFTPWNTFLLHKKLYVFDWEYAEVRPLGHDYIHFQISTQLVTPTSQDVQNIIVELSINWFNGVISVAQDALLAYLCGNTLFYALREDATSVEIDSWDGAQTMALLFEKLDISYE